MGTVLAEKEQNTLQAAYEDDVSAYLQQIRAFPRLTPEQELAVAKRCAAGDAEEALVEADLVVALADVDAVLDEEVEHEGYL